MDRACRYHHLRNHSRHDILADESSDDSNHIPPPARRLHDTGRSGWWWGAGIIATYGFGTIFVIDLGISSLINFPPAAISAFLGKFVLFAIAYIAYHIVMIVFLCQDSEPFENRYGESPKYVVDPDSDGIDTPDAKID